MRTTAFYEGRADASGSNGYFQLYAETAQSVDGLLADPSTGIAPAMNKFLQQWRLSRPILALRLNVRSYYLKQMLTQRFNYVDTRLSEFAGQLNTRMANMTISMRLPLISPNMNLLWR